MGKSKGNNHQHLEQFFFGISFLILLVFVEGFPFDFFGAVLDLSSSHSAAAYDFFNVSAAVYSSN